MNEERFVGILALLTGRTGEIITIAVFGALSLYIISMASVIQLRRKFPDMNRPFRVPLYPLTPVTALIIAIVAFIAVTIYNPTLALIYFGILGATYIWFRLKTRNSLPHED